MLKEECCKLRPLSFNDLEKVLTWRNSERIRSVMYTDHIICMEEHLSWFNKISQHGNQYHLIFEMCGKPLGVINITSVNRGHGTCFWGFYIGESAAPKGSGLAMGYMGINYIFDGLKIHKICSEALAFNTASISFHKKLGFTKEGILRQQILKNQKYADVLCFGLFQREWEAIKHTIHQLCFGGEYK